MPYHKPANVNQSLLLSTNDIIEGSFCLYVVTFVVFIVLSERLEQATSNHSIMCAKSFGTLKQYFEVIELNKTLKAANC